MRLLLDTSVLVAAMVEGHPAHQRALPWLTRVANGEYAGLVAAHSIAELYAILTTLPVQPRLSADDALQLIKRNIVGTFQIVALSDQDYIQIVEHLAELGVVGGVVYDALILRSALNAQVDQVVTLNEKDFRRAHPDLEDKIIAP